MSDYNLELNEAELNSLICAIKSFRNFATNELKEGSIENELLQHYDQLIAKLQTTRYLVKQ